MAERHDELFTVTLAEMEMQIDMGWRSAGKGGAAPLARRDIVYRVRTLTIGGHWVRLIVLFALLHPALLSAPGHAPAVRRSACTGHFGYNASTGQFPLAK